MSWTYSGCNFAHTSTSQSLRCMQNTQCFPTVRIWLLRFDQKCSLQPRSAASSAQFVFFSCITLTHTLQPSPFQYLNPQLALTQLKQQKRFGFLPPKQTKSVCGKSSNWHHRCFQQRGQEHAAGTWLCPISPRKARILVLLSCLFSCSFCLLPQMLTLLLTLSCSNTVKFIF